MINIIGLGPGEFDYITKIGEKLIYDSDILIGGKRNLESIEDFNGEKIKSIAKDAADLGIELFVLDDGWFGTRDNDDSSLGDWFVNEEKIQGKPKLKEQLELHPDWIDLINNAMEGKKAEEVIDADILAEANKLVNTSKEE